MVGAFNEEVGKKVSAYKEKMVHEVEEKIHHLQSAGWPNSFDV
jgi:hypothetical protein